MPFKQRLKLKHLTQNKEVTDNISTVHCYSKNLLIESLFVLAKVKL